MKRLMPVLALAACHGVAHPGAVRSDGACPTADRVVVAGWYDAGSFGSDDPGGWLDTDGWRVFLADQRGIGESIDRYEPITLEALRALGVTPPAAVWLYVDGMPPCKATVTRGFRMEHDDGPIGTQLGVETTGCPKPAEPYAVTYGLAGDEDLGTCTWERQVQVAARARVQSSERGVHWAPAPTATPLPPEIAARLPPHACATPGCEPLWLVNTVPSGSAFDVTRTWIGPVAGPRPCAFAHDDDTTILVDGGRGLTALPLGASAARFWMAGVFRDARGPRLVVVHDVGDFDVYAVTPTGATLARRVHWFDHDAEDSNENSVAPDCGP
ncbi:MAG: hypothetical protein K8W52_13435 [Deltaproteobacteria bacterium]|nr:hypothetical protein [Deltaproteobacteria bacterium]